MSREQYLDCTYREFVLRLRAYERMECKNWERFRWLGLKVLEPYLDKKSKLTVYDLIQLPTDPSEEERKQMLIEQKSKGVAKFNIIKDKLSKMGYKV